MIFEGIILARQLAGLFEEEKFPFRPVAPGSTLGKGSRWVWYATWPTWGRGALYTPPSPGTLLTELKGIGIEIATLMQRDRTLAGVCEVLEDGVNVTAFQQVLSKYGAVALLFYPSETVNAVPELAWDAMEAYQSAAEKVHSIDPWWWTKKVAIGVMAVSVVAGLILLALIWWRSRKVKK